MPDKKAQEIQAAKDAAEKEHLDAIFEKLIPLDKLSFFERVAAFLGKAQILEFGLKRILVRDYGYKDEDSERFTLGQTVNELREHKEDEGFLSSLGELVEHRNYIAHEILVQDVMLSSIVGDKARSFSEKRLRHALFSVEQAIHFHDHHLPKLKAQNG